MERTVIYKIGETYYVTNENNYKASIQNARAIHCMKDFDSPEEIIEYFCKYFGSKAKDFIVM